MMFDNNGLENRRRSAMLCSMMVFSLFVITMLFSGCIKTPFRPKAMVMVLAATPSPLGPTSVAGTSEIVIPMVELTVESRNSVPAKVNGYTVKFVNDRGAEIGQQFRRSGALHQYLAGEEEISFEIEVFSSQLYLTLTDAHMPVNAVIELYGQDENDNNWTANALVPLTRTVGL